MSKKAHTMCSVCGISGEVYGYAVRCRSGVFVKEWIFCACSVAVIVLVAAERTVRDLRFVLFWQ